jgi:hypothetical protein
MFAADSVVVVDESDLPLRFVSAHGFLRGANRLMMAAIQTRRSVAADHLAVVCSHSN